MTTLQQLAVLNEEIISCRKCLRLARYRERIACTKRRAYRDWTYWGRPVPGFGDPQAELLIIGLAPAAHGANRTGRMFTGDRSGDFLHRLLHRVGLANQPTSTHRGDGLALHNAYISATLRCAPPHNKPLPGETRNCLPYLEAELDLIRPRAVLALGRIAFDAYLKLLLKRGAIATRSGYKFSHGASYQLSSALSTQSSKAHPGYAEATGAGQLQTRLPRLFASYHPSQQNTQTGRLTPAMFLRVLRQIRRFLSA